MIAPILMTASLLAAPTPMNSTYPIYPSEELRANVSAGALMEMVVDEQGKITSCTVVTTAGDQAFAQSFCRLWRKFRFRPAKDVSGQSAVARVRMFSSMFIPGGPYSSAIQQLRQAPDMELRVNRLPGGQLQFDDVKLALQVDQAGTITQCAPSRDTPVNLAELACKQAKQATLPPLIGPDGNAKTFVTEWKVKFLVQ